MKALTKFLLLVVLMLVLRLGSRPGLAHAATHVVLPLPQTETLPNGLQLVWFLNDNLPVVDLELVLKSGERDDPAGKTGTASLVAELLERGAAGMTAQQIARAIEELGASRFVNSDDDTFSVGMHGLAPDAPVLLELMSKLVRKPDFPPAEVQREHARLLDRWNHLSDYGENLATLLYRRVVEAGTSYSRTGFLSPEEFSHVTRDDVVAYHQKNFTPKNAVLMIVGRVPQPEFRARIEKLFGDWQGEAPRHVYVNYADPRLRAPRGKATGMPVVLVSDRPGLTQAQVRMGFSAPLIKDPRHYSLALANAMLGEYFNSRLNALIRDKLGLTYGISSTYSFNEDLATFTISSATGNETVGQLIRRTVEVLRDFKSGPILPEEVTEAREYLTGSFPLRTSTLSAVASGWLAAHLYGLPDDYLNRFVPAVNAVTAEQVMKAVRETFDLDHLTVAVAGDAEGVEQSLRESKLDSRRIPVSVLVSGKSSASRGSPSASGAGARRARKNSGD